MIQYILYIYKIIQIYLLSHETLFPMPGSRLSSFQLRHRKINSQTAKAAAAKGVTSASPNKCGSAMAKSAQFRVKFKIWLSFPSYIMLYPSYQSVVYCHIVVISCEWLKVHM